MASFETLGDIFISLSEMLRPAERITVSEAAEKYVYLNTPGAYIGKFKTSATPYMREPMDTFTSREYRGMAFVGPAQCGKALALDTPIPTPDGWTTMGELRPWHKVFDEHGNVCTVRFVTKPMYGHVCYSVEFDDGSQIVADAGHQWFVRDDRRERSLVMTTQEMVDGGVKYGTRLHRNRYAIENAKALEISEYPDLPVDPYLLGVWLGDGGSYNDYLYLNAGDTEIIDRLIEGGNAVEVRHDQKSENCVTVILGKPLRDGLRELELLSCRQKGNVGKFIPDRYLRAHKEQRLLLLQGLLDTDGTVCARGRTTFSTSQERLMRGFRELAASLGFKTSVSTKFPVYTYKGEKRTGALSYNVNLFPYRDDEPFSLTRQLNKLKRKDEGRPTQTGSRRIVAIEPVPSVPVCCISVDSPSHLFLAGDQMIPTHNTQTLILNTLAYSVKVEPMDMMLVCPTMLDGRDFSGRRIDRLHYYSEPIGSMLVQGSNSDNTYDKFYNNGMLFTIGWPTRSQLAGKPIGRVVLTDRDRMDDDVDGDGDPFDLASKRTTTFGRYAMTLAESSPSRPVENLQWIRSTLHEAPPCKGIIGLYNQGDRRRWYWPCPHCGEHFVGAFDHLTYPTKKERPDLTNLERAEQVRMVCPHCGCLIHPDDRDEMQFWARWVKDGQAIDRDGVITGPAPRTSIASFMLNGVAASLTSWKELVTSFLDASDHYEKTGSEEKLRKFYNNDLGEPYIPRTANDVRLPEVLKARAERLPERMVPEGVRFLVATIDVQKNMWRVNVYGILPGRPFDTVVIDRFDVRKSQRTDHDGERLWVKPSTYLEDWDELIPNVIEREYPLSDGSGRMMGIKQVGCDIHGEDGVTTMAYNFYRSLREENKHRRFMFVRGDNAAGAPRARMTYPDSLRKDQKAGARGDVPVLQFNTNLLKDDLNGRLDCLVPGKGMFRFPDWMPDNFYSELCAEHRTDKGWVNPSKKRNEDTDLSAYCLGLCVSELLRVEHLDWENPQGWFAEWDKNDLVRAAEAAPRFSTAVHSYHDFAEFARILA